jgi:hypothetical protein
LIASLPKATTRDGLNAQANALRVWIIALGRGIRASDDATREREVAERLRFAGNLGANGARVAVLGRAGERAGQPRIFNESKFG